MHPAAQTVDYRHFIIPSKKLSFHPDQRELDRILSAFPVFYGKKL